MSDFIKTREKLTTPRGFTYWVTITDPLPYNEKFKKQEDQYNLQFMIEDGQDLSKLQEAILRVAKASWPKGVKDARQHSETKGQTFTVAQAFKKRILHNPLFTDISETSYPEGSVYLRAKSYRKPVCVDHNRNKVDNSSIGIGDECILSLSIYSWEFSGNVGISFGLEGIQKIGQGRGIEYDPTKDFEDQVVTEVTPAEQGEEYMVA